MTKYTVNEDRIAGKELWLARITNEIAETNRLERIKLGQRFREMAYKGLIKVYKDEKGLEHHIAADDGEKDEIKKILDFIDKQMGDQA